MVPMVSARPAQAERRLIGGDIINWTLRFSDPALETEFQNHRLNRSLRSIRIWAVIGIVVYALFGIVDYWFAPDLIEMAFAIRYGVVLPIIVFAFLFTFSGYYPRFFHALLITSITLPNLGVLTLLSVSDYPVNQVYFLMLVVILTYTYGFMGARFFYSSITSWATFLGYLLVVSVINPVPIDIGIFNATALLFITATTMFAIYNQEIYVRRDFRSHKVLARQITESELLAQRAEKAESRLREAIETISEGFALYDAQDRLVLCNDTYLDMRGIPSGKIGPGESFENIARVGLARRHYVDALEREDAWLAARIGERLSPSGPEEIALSDGRWLRADRRRIGEGGIVEVQTDVTELRRRHEALLDSEGPNGRDRAPAAPRGAAG
jgi:PAS domain-containing protein